LQPYQKNFDHNVGCSSICMYGWKNRKNTYNL